MPPVVGYNRFPDEKGTESNLKFVDTDRCSSVTTVSPMKRGLKDDSRKSEPGFPDLVTTVSPMKRGLKDRWRRVSRNFLMGYNRFPDEKGTERQRPILMRFRSYAVGFSV